MLSIAIVSPFLARHTGYKELNKNQIHQNSEVNDTFSIFFDERLERFPLLW